MEARQFVVRTNADFANVVDMQLLSQGVVFQRLLCGKIDTKSFVIRNKCLLPVKWKLAGADKLPSELQVFPVEGEIAARQETMVVVQFSAAVKQNLTEKITLQVHCKFGFQLRGYLGKYFLCT